MTQVWLRLGSELPNGEAASLAQCFPGVAFSAVEAPETEVVFTNGSFSDELVERLPALRWIHTTRGGGTGYLTPLVRERGIAVTCSRGVHAIPLAEFTEACILAFAKRLPTLWANQRAHRWDESPQPETLVGKIALFLGLGAVNGLAAERLHEHGMIVRAIRHNLNDVPAFAERVYGWDQLPAILPEADAVIVGLPSDERFRGRLGEAELRMMKPTSVLINLVSRGVTPDDVLARALREGWIGGAACNAFDRTPAAETLWDAPNMLIIPNIASGDRERWKKLKDVFMHNLQRYLVGDVLANVAALGES